MCVWGRGSTGWRGEWGKIAVKGSLGRKVKCGGVRGREQLLTRDQEGHQATSDGGGGGRAML